MSKCVGRRWLRFYPSAWRARYGEELEALISQSSDGGGRLPWSIALDLARSGTRERLRNTGLGDGNPPAERVRAGMLLVLCSWVLFVIAGVAVQKFSEHWQDATPASGRALPANAFQTLLVVAIVGSALFIAAVACALPRFLAFVRAGHWHEIRVAFLRAALLSAVVLVTTAVLARWAHGLSSPQRNGHDLGYEFAFVAWALLMLSCLVAWTGAAISSARRIEFTPQLLKIETALAAGVSLAMLTMTVATVVWWLALGHVAPWALHGASPGLAASGLALQPLAASLLMGLATALALVGVGIALRALPQLSTPPLRS